MFGNCRKHEGAIIANRFLYEQCRLGGSKGGREGGREGGGCQLQGLEIPMLPTNPY